MYSFIVLHFCFEDSEWPNNFISSNILTEYDDFNDIIKGEVNFPYELIGVSIEKGDGRDEETATGIFKRKSDGKYFSLSMHDAGFIGPETLSTSGYLEEVFADELS